MQYNLSHINKIVERFWNGKTTLKEEQLLRNLSQSSQEFRSDFPDLDSYLDQQNEFKHIPVPKNLEQNILNQTTQPKSSLKPILWFSGIAATLALLIWILPAQQNQGYSDQEVQQAYKETKNALLLLSNKMDEGNTYALKLGEFEKNQEKLKQNRNNK